MGLAQVSVAATGDGAQDAAEDRLLVFLHIPKAAGTTVSQVLARQYPRGTVFQTDPRDWLRSLDELRNLPEEEKLRLRLVHGHMGFGVHEFFPQPTVYITLLRDPVARMVSHYRYALRDPGHYLHEEIRSRRLSLLDYACSGLSPELENGQTKLLAGLDDAQMESSAKTLELARRHVDDSFLLVGLMERFDETMLLLKQDLAWGDVSYEPTNVAPSLGRDSITPEEIAAIRERNRLDLELYRWCAELFEQRLAAAPPTLARELRLLRARNAVRSVVAGPLRLARRAAGAVGRRR